MIPYYFDEAMLHLPRVTGLVDRTRHILDIQTDDGAEFGLAIVRGLVRAHAGTIAVRSAPGRGSTFEIHLPLAPAPEGRP